MPNLDLKIEEIKNEMKLDSNGIITFTIRGVSRLSGLNETTLSFTDGKINQRIAKILIEHGFELTGLARTSVPDKAAALIIEYYAFDAEKPREIAKSSYRAFASIGIRQWGQELLGWKPYIQNHPVESKLLLAVEGLTTTVNQMRDEMSNQNERINLLLPSHEMMQRIKPALLLNDGTVLALWRIFHKT